MKTKAALVIVVLALSACGGTAKAPEISRVDVPHPVGMDYNQFRNHDFNKGADSSVIQKRFLLLDRDHNGVLSSNEFGDY